MDLENTSKNWEDEAPLLAGMKVKNPFTVPENYFAELGTQVNSLRIVEDARFNNEDEFKVPENYFEGLISEIEIRVAEQNIQKIASTDGFSVQNNYFSNLPQIITEQINTNIQPPKAIVKQISTNFLNVLLGHASLDLWNKAFKIMFRHLKLVFIVKTGIFNNS